ncbi:MAG: hypothetical protein Q4C80_00675 [Bacillota bacterium]|nr:hypothetical protein [Bacillota bacterium]
MKNNIFWRLLLELKELCENNGIEYWLGGGILRYTDAVSKEMRDMAPPMSDDFGEMEIIVDGANARKLLALEDKLPNGRMFEHVNRNPRFRNLDIYYIDTESTCVDFKCLDRRESLGAFIPIRILQPNFKSGVKQSFNVKIEKMWRLCYSYHHYVTSVTPREEKMFKPVQKFSKGRRLTYFAFNHILATSFKPEYKSVNIYKRRSRVKVNSIHFATKRLLVIDGVSFTTVHDAEGYLKKMYGKEWATVNLIEPSRYVEENVSHKGLEKKLYENDEYWNRRAAARMLYQSNRSKNTVYESNWSMAKGIFAGIKLEDKLQEYKPLLLKLEKSADYPGILEIMNAYPKRVLKMNAEYGIEIDDELKQIYERAANVLEVNR